MSTEMKDIVNHWDTYKVTKFCSGTDKDVYVCLTWGGGDCVSLNKENLQRLIADIDEVVNKPLPCPFCGTEPAVDYNGHIQCFNTDCTISEWDFSLKGWNNRPNRDIID